MGKCFICGSRKFMEPGEEVALAEGVSYAEPCHGCKKILCAECSLQAYYEGMEKDDRTLCRICRGRLTPKELREARESEGQQKLF